MDDNHWEKILKPILSTSYDLLAPDTLANEVLNCAWNSHEQLVPVLPQTNPIRGVMSLSLAQIEFSKILSENLHQFPNPALALRFMTEIEELFDALSNGKSHPALEHWKNIKSDKGSRGEVTVLGQQLKDYAALSACSLKKLGLTFGLANIEVAKLANHSGVFIQYLDKDTPVTDHAIDHWKRDAKSRNKKIDHGNYELFQTLKLEKLNKEDYQFSRTFIFWREHTLQIFLKMGTALVDQMLQAGIDPVEGHEDEIRTRFYGK